MLKYGIWRINMKRKKLMCIALSAMMCASFAGFASCGDDENLVADATLTVDGNNDGSVAVSSDLFGIFLEDINYAGDSLNSELIRNKTFGYAANGGKKGWTDVGSTITSTVVSNVDDGVCSTNREYLNLVNASDNEAGISNAGFVEGMAITKGTTYDFSVYIRATSYTGNLIVRLTDGTNEYGSAKISIASSSEWVKYAAQITASDSCSESLVCQVLLDKSGSLDIDVVSLDPEDNVNGFRADLAEALKNLSPNFVRFPGGCVIEGKTLDAAYDWKDSIGVDKTTGKATTVTTRVVNADGSTSTETTTGADVARKTGGNIWTTYTDYGIGFYEYFMLCDYLGATAVPVVNCGIACMTQGNGLTSGQTVIGSEEFNYYVQSALDLVAFAKGDPDSSDANEAYWASVRVAMGHEDPFEMDYLGIGNEQWTNAYYEHYEAFRDAFIEAAKDNELYGTVELIVGNGCVFTDTEYGANPLARSRMVLKRKEGYIEKLSDYAIVDEHYYMNYTDFLDNTDHYDSYSRQEGSKYYVFAGEYSANSNTDLKGNTYSVTFNSLKTATAEAAYMTGIERNGDIVKLAAYAPVFGHLNSTYNQWAVDMIYYDNTTYVPTCNYFVQQLFAQNQSSYILNASLSYTEEAAALSTYTIGKEGKTVVKTEDSLYYVVGTDETGDIIIKIVNANPNEDINVGIDLQNASYEGTTEITVLQNEDSNAKNTKSNLAVSPVTSEKTTQKNFVYTAQKNSVTVLRIHTK